MMKTIKVTRSTVCDGKDFIKGEIYETKDESANLLIALGKAVEVDDEANVDIIEDKTVAIEDMLKDDLIEYAVELGIEVPTGATKKDIIELINALDDENEDEGLE